MKTILIAGKFDPVHDGHIAHIKKAAELGDYLYVVTHTDEIIAKVSKKGHCSVPLWARVDILRGLLLLYKINGSVIVAEHFGDDDGTVKETLVALKPHLFAKGGDRSDNSKMPQSEVSICATLGVEIRYGIGGLLNSSSKISVI